MDFATLWIFRSEMHIVHVHDSTGGKFFFIHQYFTFLVAIECTISLLLFTVFFADVHFNNSIGEILKRVIVLALTFVWEPDYNFDGSSDLIRNIVKTVLGKTFKSDGNFELFCWKLQLRFHQGDRISLTSLMHPSIFRSLLQRIQWQHFIDIQQTQYLIHQ